jgi:transposase InsO family protein
VNAKYAFINSEEGNYPVRSMCRWARVSRSGYHEWRDRPPSLTEIWRTELGDIIEAVFADSDGTYGHRRVHAVLAQAGRLWDPQTGRSIMRERGLRACQPRPNGPRTTVPAATDGLADLLRRDFTATEPGVKLVGDITYIRTWEGWVYLATVLDCFSKKAVGYAMADHMRTPLVTEALEMAIRNGAIRDGAVFHSDRGTQYMSEEFGRSAGQVSVTIMRGRNPSMAL